MGVEQPGDLEYEQLLWRSAKTAPRRLKRDRPGQRPWRDYPRIHARVLLVQELFFRGYPLLATMRHVNQQLLANGLRAVTERTIDADRSRMRDLWAGDLWPTRATYGRRRTAKPIDAYLPAPGAPAAAGPRSGLKIQRFEDLEPETEELDEPERWSVVTHEAVVADWSGP